MFPPVHQTELESYSAVRIFLVGADLPPDRPRLDSTIASKQGVGMPVVRFPGVYIKEVPSGARTITGLTTAVTAFLGRTQRGPFNRATRCRSQQDFLRMFGGAPAGSDLAIALRLFFENGGTDAQVVRLRPPAKRAPAAGWAELTGDAARATGLHALDTTRFNLMVIPRDSRVTAAQRREGCGAASRYCQERRALLLLDPPDDWTAAGSARVVQDPALVAALRASMAAEHCAVFYPPLQVPDGNTTRTVGPAGAIAGLMARTDSARGVWKAPAGTDAVLRGATALELRLTDAESGALNQLGVNCLRSLYSGIVNWGARTMAEAGSAEWKYLNVRRLALFIEASIEHGTQWVVFEPNDERTWTKVREVVGTFLYQLFRQGALAGSKAEQAYFVRCGPDTMTRTDIANGRVIIEIGFAPLKPAEFVILRINHRTSEAD